MAMDLQPGVSADEHRAQRIRERYCSCTWCVPRFRQVNSALFRILELAAYCRYLSGQYRCTITGHCRRVRPYKRAARCREGAARLIGEVSKITVSNNWRSPG